MTTLLPTSNNNSQIHNDIMAACSKDHPPMLATGRYAQWQSRFMRYIDTRPNSIHLILTGIGDDIYSTIDACTTAKEMWTTIERLQQAKNANPLALVVAAQHYPKYHNQALKPHKSIAPSSRQITSSKSHATTRSKGKELVKPATPPSKSASEEDKLHQTPGTSTLILLQRLGMTEILSSLHMVKECRKPKRAKDYVYHKEKMLLYKQVEKGAPLSAEQGECLDDTNEEPDKQELEAHYLLMTKIQEVPSAES
ncbi:hypothetical protein Tco_0867613 [Tanacetum coccineum]